MGRQALLKTRIKVYFSISVVSAVVSSLQPLCIPFVSLDGTSFQKRAAYILAAVFWLSLMLELCMVWMCSSERKRLEHKKVGFGALLRARRGAISFAKTLPGTVADAVMLLSLIAVVITVWTETHSQWLILVLVSVLCLSFQLHCLMNGKNYRYIKLLSKYAKEHEKWVEQKRNRPIGSC